MYECDSGCGHVSSFAEVDQADAACGSAVIICVFVCEDVRVRETETEHGCRRVLRSLQRW